ncbi:MAG: hypothetical protein JXQ30_00710 [Spirochaetes bacterium]|nr:hypothetical protein [Spirochaetota bacterium]
MIPKYKKHLDVLKSLNVYRFNKDEFLKECELRKGSIKGLNPIRILKDLYEFSIIGFYTRGGKGFGGSEYIYKYKDPTQEFDETSNLFQVHLGLIDVLGLKRYEKK